MSGANLRLANSQETTARIREFLDDGSVRLVENFEYRWNVIKANCESPIEELLAAALFVEGDMQFCRTGFLPLKCPNVEHLDVCIYQQASIGPYRVDFVFVDALLESARLVIVECDGHDFHERTKAQAERDRKADRYFQSKGFTVLRFTGSEIYRDASACVEEIFEQIGAGR